jgi:hypothetical protein
VSFNVREKTRYSPARLRRWETQPATGNGAQIELTEMEGIPKSTYERVYAWKPGTRLGENREFEMTGYLQQGNRWVRLFRKSFWTNRSGVPIPF